MKFTPFPKMARLNRECLITEKIDGTNASIIIATDADILADEPYDNGRYDYVMKNAVARDGDLVMLAGSRKRFITPQDDNFGFAAWVKEHADELFGLGVGQHFGEWYGRKIQRGYGLDERRFALFNASRWIDVTGEGCGDEVAPSCCEVVPVLYRGPFDTHNVNAALAMLRAGGSVAVPGFMDPEGIVVFHTAGNVGFKATCKNDASPKSLVA